MKKYVLHRFLQLIPILLGITFLSFAMMRLAGSDVVTEMYQNRGTEVSQEIIDAKRAELGLDQPFLIQYGRWLGGMLTGDMGESYMTGKPVFPTFLSKLPATLLLTALSIILTILVSIPFGILAAVTHDKIPDLILLDIMLPDQDGLEIVRKLRERPETVRVPIILVTAKTTELDKVKGLDIGADDYLTKPFGVMELISRVKALLRRSKSIQEDQILRLKNVTLDSEKRIVHVNDIPCELTFKEFELLKLLMINAGIVLRREVIMMDVWGTDYEGESRTLDMHIKTLRQKLGDAGNMIKTVRNVGYKME